MASTYTLNNGIELIGTGEQSGTWGDTTNTNLSLVDTALDGQVTVTLPSAGTSGSPNTLAISDGAASDGRNRMVTFNDGGDLGATAYVQLTPNDAEKIIYVRNDLAGSRSIILFQGTYNASNDYELPAGTTAVIYFDGAGSGAVAANVFNNAYFDSLRLGSVSVDKILDEDNMASDDASALATQQSIKAYVDSQVTAQDLDFGGDSGTGAVDLDSQTFTIAGTSNEIETSASGQTLTIGLPDDVTIAGDLTVDTDTLYVDSTNNRVGIGTSSPDSLVHANNTSGDATVRITSSDTGYAQLFLGDQTSGSQGRLEYYNNNDSMGFYTSGSEAMRIDSSQRVLIGDDTSKAIGSSSTGILQIHDTTAFSILARYTSGTGGPLFVLGKAKTDTIGGNTLVADNDTLGNIRFAGADGTDVQSYAAEIVTQVDGTPGSNDMPGRLTFWTTADGASSSTERMRISQDGNVAIGDTGTDYARLAVRGSFADAESTGFDSQVMYLTNTEASKLTGITMIAASDNGTIAQVGRIGTYNVHPATGYLGEMTFSTRDGLSMIEAMRIDQVQRVNIGGLQTAINGSSSKLQILGDSKATSLISSLRFSNDSGPPHFIFGKSRSGTISTVGTTVQSGDTLGYLAWAADDGTDLGTVAAAIDVEVDGTPGSNDMPGRMRFFTTADGAASTTERMRINNEGHVGIGGAADPDQPLHLTAEPPVFRMTNPQGTVTLGVSMGKIEWETRDAGAPGVIGYIDVVDSNNFGTAFDMKFASGASGSASEAMRINSQTYVVISSTGNTRGMSLGSTTSRLTIEGTSATAGRAGAAAVHNTNDTSGPVYYLAKSRGTVNNSNTIVLDDDYLGQLNWNGADGTQMVQAGNISLRVDGTPGLNDMPGRLEFFTTSDGANSPTKRMTIDSSGNLLVDTSSTSIIGLGGLAAKPQGSGVRLDISNSGGATMLLDRRSNDGDIITFYRNGTTVGSITSRGGVVSSIVLDPRTGGGGLGATGPGALCATNNTGSLTTDNVLDLGNSGARWKDVYVGGGVYLGGTVAANKLDEYEEGTWTPGAKGHLSGNTMTVTAEGSYVKIGNQVTVNFIVTTTAVGSASGSLQITGLPFTVADVLVGTGIEANGKATYWTGFATAINSLGYAAEGGTNLIYVYGCTSSTQTSISSITVSHIGGSAAIRGTISYRST